MRVGRRYIPIYTIFTYRLNARTRAYPSRLNLSVYTKYIIYINCNLICIYANPERYVCILSVQIHKTSRIIFIYDADTKYRGRK